MADNRFWKSEVSVLSELLPEALEDELSAVPESDDVLLDVELSDCAIFSMADARSLP